MKIMVRCPKCGNIWLYDKQAADRRITCPKCRKLFKIPEIQNDRPGLDIIKMSRGSVFVDENGNIYG